MEDIIIVGVRPYKDTINKPYPGYDNLYPDAGCMFCCEAAFRCGVTIYWIHNSPSCYIACRNRECNDKAATIARTINDKIARLVSAFVDVDTISGIVIGEEEYRLDIENGNSFVDMLAKNNLNPGYCITVPDMTYVSVEYDHTDPAVVTEENFKVFLYVNRKRDNACHKIYIDQDGIMSVRHANFFTCK